ncbi:MAG: thiamine phosphate synthase [bacterium]|jgi:thiamine-phosphate pyrophosphorylase
MSGLHSERMQRFQAAGLYLVTSQALSAERTTVEIVRAALAGGVKLIQLREKSMPLCDYVKLAEQIRAMTSSAGCLLIINDRVDVALAVGADGVHLGQDDFPIPAARRLAPEMIIGSSTHNVEEAVRAQNEGASYINIGPIYPTGTKVWKGEYLGLEGLRTIATVARIPFTVMGGIKKSHFPGLIAAGARTIALVTAVTAAPDPEEAARTLLGQIVSSR